jgi:hypothetical protein
MKFSKIIKVLFITFGLGVVLQNSTAHAQENIALGKSVVFSTRPHYPLCTDPDDARQITDGLYGGNAQSAEGTSALWVQKGTAGWVRVYPAITIDLEKVQPISGISYSTAAGISGVQWPETIYIAVSDDNKTWHYLGDLIRLSQAPAGKGLINFRYVTHALHTKGRYVALGIVGNPYVFVDEIEVYGGAASWLNQSAGGREIPALSVFMQQSAVAMHVRNRLNQDIAGVLEQLHQAPLTAAQKSTFAGQLDHLEEATQKITTAPVDLKTVLPLNETHQRILALHREILAAQGFKPLTVWKKQRYAWLPLLARPDAQNAAQVQFSMLRDQFRSDDLLLTNATSAPMNVQLKLSKQPSGAESGWLQISSVEWTDTRDSLAVADALLPVNPQNGVYNLEIPAGMTRKIWLTVDSSKVLSGSYKSTFTVSGAGQQISVPLRLDIAQLAMKTPRFSLGMWDYTNNGGSFGMTRDIIPDAIQLMRSHYVDTPWADPRVFNLRQWRDDDFDAGGNFIKQPDFSALDQWISLWPGARHYFVFANAPDAFAGAKQGTPEFNARVENWAKVLSAHLRRLGLQPQQLGILLLDEPRNDAIDATVAAWAKAINAAAPELTLFENPIWMRPDQTKIQDAVTQMDVLSPNFPIYQKGGEPVQKYFEDLRQQGKELWFYQCSGPIRSYSPQLYYRYNA